MGAPHMPTAAGHHPLKSCPRHEALPHDNTLTVALATAGGAFGLICDSPLGVRLSVF